MKNNSNCIVSFNMNAWLPVNRSLSLEEKISNFAVYVQSLCDTPMIICLQEMFAGKGGTYLKLLEKEFPEYEVISPAGFDFKKHYKSIMCVTLILKDALNNYTVNVLDDECLPNRVNYIIADINGVCVRIINVHIPQIVVGFKTRPVWYRNKRKKLNEEMWRLLVDEAKAYKDAELLIAGDFQESYDGSNIAKLKEVGYGVYTGEHLTVDIFPENIDHIIFSKPAVETLNPITLLTDSSVVGKLSDHGILYAVCTN